MKDACFLRKGMIAELDTVNEYRKMMEQCESADAKKLFASIIEEELVHVGEFQYLMEKLCEISKTKIEEGKKEAEELLNYSSMLD